MADYRQIGMGMMSIVRRRLGWRLLPTLAAAAAFSIHAPAQTEAMEPGAAQADTQYSPPGELSKWLFVPVLSSNPKLGTSFGLLAGYLHYFDQESRPSMFAVTGQYTSTKSIVAGAFARTSFDEDHQRMIAAIVYGNIKNDYDDYLGTGIPLRNEADLHAYIARYTYRVTGDWFAGAQGIHQNFGIAGATEFDDLVLDFLGIRPYKSAGLGVVVEYDSRDNENMPGHGWLFNVNNIAYRKPLGSDKNYDFYHVDTRYIIPHGSGHVVVLRQLNNLTDDAPAAARASIQLRGYKTGQYAGKYMSSIEGEERYRFAERWTATLFAGGACIYGDGKNAWESENIFLAGGAGVQYILKPKEGIVLNLEYAHGEGGNYGIYMKMGYAY